MSGGNFLFTSESVTEGHPDKICDQISDGVLDDVLRQDRRGRVACETFVSQGLVIVGGEITTSAYVDIHKLVRGIVKRVGYTHGKFGFAFDTCAILNAIGAQSADIAMGVDRGGAGDAGEWPVSSVRRWRIRSPNAPSGICASSGLQRSARRALPSRLDRFTSLDREA